jgi:hypothetical protein
MAGGGRSGISVWLAGLLGLLAYRSGQRSAEGGSGRSSRAGPGRGSWGGGADGGPALREVRLPDGRDALQVTASLFVREEGDTEVWRRVALEGTAACQDELTITLGEVAPGQRTAQDVPVVLMPMGTRRRVNAVDVFATGGRVGYLPEFAVNAVGDAVRATQLADGRPCAVMSRIAPDPSGVLQVEVLLPETFRPGTAA